MQRVSYQRQPVRGSSCPAMLALWQARAVPELCSINFFGRRRYYVPEYETSYMRRHRKETPHRPVSILASIFLTTLLLHQDRHRNLIFNAQRGYR